MISRRIASLALIGVLVAACRGPSGAPPPTLEPSSSGDAGRSEPFVVGETLRVDLPRVESNVSDADISAVVRGDRALGLDLLRTTAGESNLMVSPYSVATALGMLYAGARGDTKSEISKVLHLEVEDATLHGVRNAIDEMLAETESRSPEDDREPFVIHPANSAWGQGGYPFLDDYLGILAEYYGAGLRLLDFESDPTGSAATINDWTEETTEGRITDLLPSGAINESTRLVLVNAVWFKANWADEFDPEKTAPGPFTLLDGTRAQVPMMQGLITTGYADTSRFVAVRLPFAGEASMVVAVPKSGAPSDLLATLGADDLEITWERSLVDLSMPNFEFESSVDLTEALPTLGMSTAFQPPTGSDGADFTGISEARELFLSQALQKTFVTVDEHGAEAAAATALAVQLTSAMPPLPRVTMDVDRPFLFWIEDTRTGEPLFLGQVTSPSSE